MRKALLPLLVAPALAVGMFVNPAPIAHATLRASQVEGWHQAAAYPGAPTWFSAAVVVADKAYVGTGYDFGASFWEFDPARNAWTRKADFPGTPRGAACAFSLGQRVYFGTGFRGDTRFGDLWEYDPATDRWAEKAGIPGGPRDQASAFTVGERAYVAGGMTCEAGTCSELREVWEYERQPDRWTRKSDMPEAASAAAAFVLGGKAYVVGGRAGDAFSKNVLEYDAQADRWSRKATFPGSSRARAVAFASGARGYVAAGMRAISATSASVLRDVWEYDQQHDAWTQRADLPGPARGAAIGFVVGSRVFLGTGMDGARRLLADFWQADRNSLDEAPREAAAGVNRLPPAAVTKIDALVSARMRDCRLLAIGVVVNGRIVLTKAYGEGRLAGEYEYGSVSKPVTSTILVRLRDEKRIESLDDNVWKYVRRYAEAMPPAFKDARLTLKQLLMHRSGIPHNDRPPLVNGVFNLQFEPGTQRLYSTPGYGVLGQVIEAVTGMSYSDAVRKYVGEPVGARSFRAYPTFIAPGAYVTSNIEDMARFAVGVMSHQYMRPEVLYGEVLRPDAGSYGYGWQVSNLDTDDLVASHAGSNGLPRAHVLLEPRRQSAVVVLAELSRSAPLDLDALAQSALIAARTLR